jgi:lipoate-protein ligase A
LAILGVGSEFVPINDIVSAGRKISGNAQTRKKGCLLQHGTILLDVDVEKMFSLLMVPKEKAKGKLIEDVKARVGSLSAILGRPVGFTETASALEEGFVSALGLDPVREEPKEEELALAHRLAEEKFSRSWWVHKR